MTKTAAAVIQEFAVYMGTTPEYECISQSGPQHASMFEYRCTVCNVTTTAKGRSKKEAKQESARLLLEKLACAGLKVPPPWGMVTSAEQDGQETDSTPGMFSYVALLHEYCLEYRLPTPEYSLVGDTGPPHHRWFTMRVKVGSHTRDATALNKKSARQSCAEMMYKYLRSSLPTTQDFVEADALTRQLNERMGRNGEENAAEPPFRLPLTQRLSDYQCGLIDQFDADRRSAAMEALARAVAANQTMEEQLRSIASALNLQLEWRTLDNCLGPPYIIVELLNTSPSLVHYGTDKDVAAAKMIDYLNTYLVRATPDPLPTFLEKKEKEKE